MTWTQVCCLFSVVKKPGQTMFLPIFSTHTSQMLFVNLFYVEWETKITTTKTDYELHIYIRCLGIISAIP